MNNSLKNNKLIFWIIVAFIVLGLLALFGSKFLDNKGGDETESNSQQVIELENEPGPEQIQLPGETSEGQEQIISEGQEQITSEGQEQITSEGQAETTVEGSMETSAETTVENPAEITTELPAETTTETPAAMPENTSSYRFRNDKLLSQHYEKHGIEMGFDSKESYEAAAAAVIVNPEVLTKTEKEDGDFVYYVESTNEFVIVSKDGYIRTYFNPSAGKAYYDRQ